MIAEDDILHTAKQIYDKLTNYYNINVEYEDICQDLFIRHLNAKSQYKSELASFKTYWNKIVKNYVRELLRRYKYKRVYTSIVKKNQKPFFKYLYKFDNKELFEKFKRWHYNNNEFCLSSTKHLVILTDCKAEWCEQYRYTITYK